MDQNVFEVQDVFSIMGRGTIVTGSLLSGQLVKGMKVNVNGKEAVVDGIEAYRKQLGTVVASDETAKAIGILLSDVIKEDFTRGQTLLFG